MTSTEEGTGQYICLLNKYLKGIPPYIDTLTYDLDEREIIIVFWKRDWDSTSRGRLTFTDVRSFSENMLEDAFEENLADSIMGLYRKEEGLYLVLTEKRELTLRVGEDPVSDFIPLKP